MTEANYIKNISPEEEVFFLIDDLYAEAKNWADGEPISSQEQHDEIERLYKALYDAGKQADELRVSEKKPLDEQVKAIQDKYNPYIQPKKGKVDVAKDCLNVPLAAWRKAQAEEKQRIADEERRKADELREKALAAMQSSKANLEAREQAEEIVKESEKALAAAKRSEKKATTGLGLRSHFVVTIENERDAVAHYWKTHRNEFLAVAQRLAEADVRSGKREISGFKITEEKKAI